MKKAVFLSLTLLIPTFALAQTLSAQSFITGFLAFSNKVLIPFLLGFAFLFFVFNAFRFFVVNGGNEDGRKNAKNLAIYGVLAFVVLIVFWGVVNLLASSIGFNRAREVTPDYIEKNGTSLQVSPGGSANGNAAGNNTTGVSTNGTSDEPLNLISPNTSGKAGNTGNNALTPPTQNDSTFTP